MDLAGVMKRGGRGIIATASAGGVVNTAVYSYPHIVDEATVAWGMTEGRTYRNVRENPQASYLYINPGQGFSGARLNLKLKKIEDSGAMLEEIKSHTSEVVGPGAGQAVKYVAYFTVVEMRTLV